MKKLLLPLPFLLCLLLLLLPVFADDNVRVEEYDGFTYTYDTETYTLTISGEGCVKLNKAFNRNSVRRLVFSEGITEIRNSSISTIHIFIHYHTQVYQPFYGVLFSTVKLHNYVYKLS